MNDLLLKIDAKDLARVVPFAAQQDVRYYLNGVCIEPCEGGAVLVATNGHLLAALQSPTSFVTETTILALTKRFMTEIRKAGAKRGADAFVELRDAKSYAEIVTTVTGRFRAQSRTVEYVSPGVAVHDAKYPEWRGIIPADEDLVDGLTGAYNASYLEMAAASAANGPRSKYNGLRFQHSKKNPDGGPLVVRTSENRSMVILIMAMRDELNQPMPEWTRKPKPAEQAAA